MRLLPGSGVVAATLVFAPLVAAADPVVPDVRTAREPVSIRMRPVPVVRSTRVGQAAPGANPVVAPSEDSTYAATGNGNVVSSGELSTPRNVMPRNLRQLREHVTVHVRAGMELAGAPASGERIRGGASLPDGFTDYRPWIAGDALVSARDLVLPSLGGYFLSSFAFDAGDTLATRAGAVAPEDADGQNIAIKAGYAEWGRDEREPGRRLWLRGGRQFRLDGGALFAYFDGATVGWKDEAWNASAFAGQRVVLYVDTPRGVTFGATAAVDLAKLGKPPVKIALDAMGLSISDETRALVAVTGNYEYSAKMQVDARVRVVDDGEGFGFGRAGARVTYAPTRELMLVGDLEQRGGGDLAFDLAAPSAVDVVDVARQLGVGLAQPISATTVGARANLRRGDKELFVFARVELPNETPTRVDQWDGRKRARPWQWHR